MNYEKVFAQMCRETKRTKTQISGAKKYICEANYLRQSSIYA